MTRNGGWSVDSDAVDALDRFLADLASAQIGTTFNQYRDADAALDRPGAAQVRLGSLAAYLRARPHSSLLLVGEAAGYAGCRFSGIPSTSERCLPPGSVDQCRCPQGPRRALHVEHSASIVHRDPRRAVRPHHSSGQPRETAGCPRGSEPPSDRVRRGAPRRTDHAPPRGCPFGTGRWRLVRERDEHERAGPAIVPHPGRCRARPGYHGDQGFPPHWSPALPISVGGAVGGG